MFELFISICTIPRMIRFLPNTRRAPCRRYCLLKGVKDSFTLFPLSPSNELEKILLLKDMDDALEMF